ncbi:MAG TPA: alpha/beta fold hydrolase [Actinomycetota bacterium]|nr:alpha/beta fold hydrolase [Actinomycetota bacterium]
MSLRKALDHVRSADGTRIAVWRSGDAKPLVCLHGIAVDHGHWDAVRPLLEDVASVVAVDRRGHGASEPGPASYSLAEEVADLAAVIEACGGRADVLAHSYGGLVALEAALLDLPIDRLVVYEPSVAHDPAWPGIVARVADLVGRGQTERAAETLLIESAGVPAGEVAAVHDLPLWPVILRGVEVLPREGREIVDYLFRPERFAELAPSTLVLVGEHSPAYLHEAMRALDGAAPDSKLRVLAGQEHVAAQAAPDLFVAEILRFWGR